MGSFCCVSDPWVCSCREDPDSETLDPVTEEEAWARIRSGGNEKKDGDDQKKKKEKKKNQVMLEAYVEAGDDEDDLKRSKSLTDDDLEELKGCLDLGFGFSYEEIPELCSTLPALELCYSMSQKFRDDTHHKSPKRAPVVAEPPVAAGPIASWKISSPGDNPDDVKARLKYWAQAVACTVRLCS